MQIFRLNILKYHKKDVSLHIFLKDIHNKDYSVVKTSKVACGFGGMSLLFVSRCCMHICSSLDAQCSVYVPHIHVDSLHLLVRHAASFYRCPVCQTVVPFARILASIIYIVPCFFPSVASRVLFSFFVYCVQIVFGQRLSRAAHFLSFRPIESGTSVFPLGRIRQSWRIEKRSPCISSRPVNLLGNRVNLFQVYSRCNRIR